MVKTEPSLGALLAAHPKETDVDHAFSTLFGLWKAQYVADKTDPCSQASRQGLECLVERGSFGQLRLYNRPAILVLSDERGSHQVVLSRLGEADARIELAGESHRVPIADLSRYWLGDFVILWQPGAQAVKDLSFGMRDDSVPWLRHSLLALRGLPASQTSSSTLFDADLSRMVMDFQREHRLTIDGIAGVQTQVILSAAVPKPDSPLLVSNVAHGS
jgi:general secretion pathway protein A